MAYDGLSEEGMRLDISPPRGNNIGPVDGAAPITGLHPVFSPK
jgi:hypothetical protein